MLNYRITTQCQGVGAIVLDNGVRTWVCLTWDPWDYTAVIRGWVVTPTESKTKISTWPPDPNRIQNKDFNPLVFIQLQNTKCSRGQARIQNGGSMTTPCRRRKRYLWCVISALLPSSINNSFIRFQTLSKKSENSWDSWLTNTKKADLYISRG